MKDYDLAIIGGGIMGLMTAYYASGSVKEIVILEKRTIGNKQAASFSYTRSMRTDYLDSFYARLANESRELWLDLQQRSSDELLINCGCLNIAKATITPVLDKTYGAQSYKVISDLNYGPKKFSNNELQEQFPQFVADTGYLDIKGGYFDLTAVTTFLISALKEHGVTFIENSEIYAITEANTKLRINTNNGSFNAHKLVITAGMGTNGVLKRVKGNTLILPLTYDRPKECKYYYPSPDKRATFLPDKFPVFAYLDVGIYGHPIFDPEKGAVKISYYNPPDLKNSAGTKINSVADFVAECLPALKGARSQDVTDADQCFYDLVADDNFILGRLPNFDNIVIGTGWRGTGYKFAPLIGKIMSQLALQNGTIYDISTFSPGRFTK